MITKSPLQFYPDEPLSGKEPGESAWLLLLRLRSERDEHRYW